MQSVFVGGFVGSPAEFRQGKGAGRLACIFANGDRIPLSALASTAALSKNGTGSHCCIRPEHFVTVADPAMTLTAKVQG